MIPWISAHAVSIAFAGSALSSALCLAGYLKARREIRDLIAINAHAHGLLNAARHRAAIAAMSHGEQNMTRVGRDPWPFEFIEAARSLWAQGLTSSEIGRRLKVTKNVVIGIARRNNFPDRPSPIKRAA